MSNHDNHLNLIKIFHYIMGGLGCVFGMFPLIYVVIGQLVLHDAGPMANEFGNTQSEIFARNMMGTVFTVIGVVAFLILEAGAICALLSAKFIKERRNYWFSFVLACLMCLSAPFGTALGIFTIITLMRKEVKQAYGVSL